MLGHWLLHARSGGFLCHIHGTGRVPWHIGYNILLRMDIQSHLLHRRTKSVSLAKLHILVSYSAGSLYASDVTSGSCWGTAVCPVNDCHPHCVANEMLMCHGLSSVNEPMFTWSRTFLRLVYVECMFE